MSEQSVKNPFSSPLNIGYMLRHTPPALDHVLPGLLAGSVGLMVGPGGVSKTMLALQLGIAMATGTPFLGGLIGGDGVRQLEPQRAVLVLAEESAQVVWHRLHAIASVQLAMAGIDPDTAIELLERNLVIYPLAGEDQVNLLGECGEKTASGEFLRKACEGARLVIIDPLRQFHNDDENSASVVTTLVRHIASYAASTGAAWLLAAHTSRAAALNGYGDSSDAARGSTALPNSVRWQMNLSRPTRDKAKLHKLRPEDLRKYVLLDIPKSNYLETPDTLVLVWGAARCAHAGRGGRMSRTSPPSKVQATRMVRLAKPFGLCQLFRPLPKGHSVRPTLNESYHYGDLELRFSAREALGAPEQTLLLALLELAHEQHNRRPNEHRLDRADRSEIGTLLWTSLHSGGLQPLAEAPATLKLSCTWSELHRRCGSASVGGAVTASRRMSLARLCEVTVWESVETTKTVRSGRLVSWLVGDDHRVHVALNHRLAAALLVPDYAQVLMAERLQLPSQTAMLVHAFLSTCLRGGHTMSIGYERLVERLWPRDTTAVPPSTSRRRLSDVRSALRAIGGLGRWRVELGHTKANITRAVSSTPNPSPEQPMRVDARPETAPTASARQMTRRSHFALPSASYAEQPFWKKPTPDGHLPRNDEVGTTS
jgi:hypothetical protein